MGITLAEAPWTTPRPVQAAFFDVDGTLLSFDTRGLPDSAREALVALRQRGIHPVVCTGRAPFQLDADLARLFDACIFLSGSLVLDGRGEVIESHTLDQGEVAAIAAVADEGCCPVLFMCTDRLFAVGENEHLRISEEQAALHFDRGDTSMLEGSPVVQLNVFATPEYDVEVQGLLPHAFTARWSEHFCDVIPRGSGKGVGVRAVLAHYGIGPDEAVAFGDGGNDLQMFAAVGTSVAMGQALPDVQDAATYVTGTPDEDGIWHACRALGLV